MTLTLFVQEHNIKQLTTIGDLVLYKIDENDYKPFRGSIDELFEIEYEQVYSINFDFENILKVEILESVPWHLDRITKKHLPLNNSYPYSEHGSCHRNSNVEIETYVVDTGCDDSHPEFEGRAKLLENFSGDGEMFDGNGHGTHCSGLIGSKTYGVCKDAKIKCVKVLDAQGSGSTSSVIAGMDFAFNRHLTNEKINSKIKSIMSMSLGGGYSKAINRVVEQMVKISNTFYIVVAAGNENNDACRTSPASAKGILTVMAMDQHDNRASFSNYGPCTDIYSPGVDIQSTIPNGKTAVYSGTSMATPILVGILIHYLDIYPDLNMKAIKEKMLSDATKDIIKKNTDKTPNLLVFLLRKD